MVTFSGFAYFFFKTIFHNNSWTQLNGYFISTKLKIEMPLPNNRYTLILALQMEKSCLNLMIFLAETNLQIFLMQCLLGFYRLLLGIITVFLRDLIIMNTLLF